MFWLFTSASRTCLTKSSLLRYGDGKSTGCGDGDCTVLVGGVPDVAASRPLISVGVNCKLVRFWPMVSGGAGDGDTSGEMFSTIPHGDQSTDITEQKSGSSFKFFNFLAASFVSFDNGGRQECAHIIILSNSPNPCWAMLWARNAMGFSCIPHHLG